MTSGVILMPDLCCVRSSNQSRLLAFLTISSVISRCGALARSRRGLSSRDFRTQQVRAESSQSIESGHIPSHEAAILGSKQWRLRLADVYQWVPCSLFRGLRVIAPCVRWSVQNRQAVYVIRSPRGDFTRSGSSWLVFKMSLTPGSSRDISGTLLIRVTFTVSISYQKALDH
jgi:hypothetical protein